MATRVVCIARSVSHETGAIVGVRTRARVHSMADRNCVLIASDLSRLLKRLTIQPMWSHFLYPPSPSHSEAIRPDCLIPLHFTTHVSLDIYKAENTLSILDYRTSNPKTRNTSLTHRLLKVFNFSPTAPTSIHNGVPDQQNTPEGAGPADRRQLGCAKIRRDKCGQVRGRNRSGHCTVSGVRGVSLEGSGKDVGQGLVWDKLLTW